jgi:ubiquinone/menaquinone biosynthesis C-methylase UbiE
MATDIVPKPWLDAAADACSLPFKSDSFSNIVGIDVLHHLERPKLFFHEIQRVLSSPASNFFYNFLFMPGVGQWQS